MRRSLAVRLLLVSVLAGACGDDGPAQPHDDAAVPDDTTPPTVVGTTPGASATAVAPTTAITVTFSEPMDPATITATTITLAPATSASVTWDEAAVTATVTPTAPLHRGAMYKLTVGTGATDLAGNSLEAPFTSTFTIESAPPVRIDTGGAAIMDAPITAYDAAGNGVVVWSAEKAPGLVDLYYATFSAGAWAPETRIVHDASLSQFRLATNGSTFMLVASTGATLQAITLSYDAAAAAWTVSAPTTVWNAWHDDLALVSNGSAYLATWRSGEAYAALFTTAWATPTVLSSGNILGGSLRAASDGDAFAVGWLQYVSGRYTAHLAVRESAGWQPTAPMIETGVTASASDLELAGSTDQSGFIAVWSQDPPSITADTIYADRYVRSGGTGTLKPAERVSPTTSSSRTPHVAAGAAGTYAVVWTQGGIAYLAPWSGTAWGAAEQVSAGSIGTGSPRVVRAGPRYLVAWLTPDGTSVGARVRNAGSWETEQQLVSTGATATAMSIVASGGFGIAHREVPATGVPRVVRTLYTGGAWGTPTVVSNATDDVRGVIIGERGNQFITAWSQDTDLDIRAGGGIETLTTQPHQAHAVLHQLAGSLGRAVVTWQQAIGQRTAVLASTYGATGWSPPVAVGVTQRSDAGEGLASRAGTFVYADGDGTRFHDGTAWHAPSAFAGARVLIGSVAANPDEYLAIYAELDQEDVHDPVGWYSRTTTDGTWSDPVVVPFDTPDVGRLALVPGAHGFATYWLDDNGALRAALYAAGSWGAAVTVDVDHLVVPGRVAFASHGDGQLVAWLGYDAVAALAHVYVANYDGTTWSTPAIVADTPDTTGTIVAASSDSGYAIAWSTSDGSTSAAVYTGSWSSPQTVATGSQTFNTPPLYLASEGSDYTLASSHEDGSMHVVRWDGVMWSAPTIVLGAMAAFAVGVPGGYRVGAMQTDPAVELRAFGVSSAGLGSPTTLDAAVDVLDSMPLAASTGGTAAAVWRRAPAAAEPSTHGIYGSGGL